MCVCVCVCMCVCVCVHLCVFFCFVLVVLNESYLPYFLQVVKNNPLWDNFILRDVGCTVYHNQYSSILIMLN